MKQSGDSVHGMTAALRLDGTWRGLAAALPRNFRVFVPGGGGSAVSGCGAFSPSQLLAARDAMATAARRQRTGPLVVVDLRRETHVYVNRCVPASLYVAPFNTDLADTAVLPSSLSAHALAAARRTVALRAALVSASSSPLRSARLGGRAVRVACVAGERDVVVEDCRCEHVALPVSDHRAPLPDVVDAFL
jgi:hypothetical protein